MRELKQYKKIKSCRICGGSLTENVLDLGDQALTGVFTKIGAAVPTCKMSLSMCQDNNCGLVQINEVYDMDLLYGDHYGYASSLNASMVDHLKHKAKALQSKLPLDDGDIVVDIGSNDATTLSFFPSNVRKIGVDATGSKFFTNYKKINAELVPEFFPSKRLTDALAGDKVKIISSYSCFYDLPDPVKFARGIAAHLCTEGIWCLEQSYLPTMLKTNSFDTVCHEHVEYYRLLDIQNICNAVGLRIFDVAFNNINGGSFSVEVVHKNSVRKTSSGIEKILKKEKDTDWSTEFKEFRVRVDQNKLNLLEMLSALKAKGKRIVGLGASTKGNVLLQHYGITTEHIDCIGEVNKEKFGCQTPGSSIPIVSEDHLLDEEPDYFLVMPWHFKEFFLRSKKFKGRTLIFPLPEVEVIEV